MSQCQEGKRPVIIAGVNSTELRKVKLTQFHCPEGAMAAESPLESLQNEAACPICQELFKNPVVIDCGHSFCQVCITQCWEGSDANFTCPKCRETAQQRNLRLNRQLANVLEIAKGLSFQAAKRAEGKGVCGDHQESLNLFCEEDQTPICMVCDRSWAHRAHTVVPIEDAAQEYKRKIQAHLETLQEEREKLLGFKVTGAGKTREYLIQTQAERQKIVSEFQQLRQFLEEQERLLLARLEKLDRTVVKIQNDNVSKLSEISHLSELISELEGKGQKPASEFLQDFRSTLSRCEKGKFQQSVEISPELEKRLSDFSQENIALMESVRKFKDTLLSELETGAHRQVTVTLDPDTAHPQLILSEDRKSVRWGYTRQDLPDNPERFDTELCVLGCEGFTWGRHCWEVELGDGRRWAAGVARESVRRKGWISHNPEGGIWAVQWWGHQFQALTFPETPLPLSRVPRRIRVSLDCEWGQVTFFDADNEAPIFTFPPASFTGQRIRSWFWVWTGSQLRQYC
ncbi:E3 ubiquitin-protein ligase TRIM39-like isoform X1 [Dermochelys coriacea]|uniref:E3 ubiquitin-protein ligase TRIM39-like isoform X1 n=1 Tax=Dermochelys coriacea TaxID=27794 RepID=UPI001CA907F6|nr:E3 ubiquitin-protein ligase TRIM39-like isoform X1 [Dermochelys coriacea]